MNIKSIMAKVKEKAAAAKKKLVETDKKYPWLKYAVIVCGGYAAYRIGFNYGCNETAKAEIDFLKQDYPEAYDIVVGNKKPGECLYGKSFVNNNLKKIFGEGDPHFEAYKKYWTENYRTNFEKLVEFAKDLELKPCEQISVGYFVDPDSEPDVFRKYLFQQCGNDGYIKIELD